MNYRITHTELWPYKRKEHDDITLPKDAMLAYLGKLLYSAKSAEREYSNGFSFIEPFLRADGAIDTMEHFVWVEPLQEGSES